MFQPLESRDLFCWQICIAPLQPLLSEPQAALNCLKLQQNTIRQVATLAPLWENSYSLIKSEC